MESTMVTKVRYGEMLRRFSVRVHENGRLDLDINGLREKIRNLFSFSSDDDFTMTYIDEDGDVVTLVNDDDLHELMRQQLKFLKIDVHLRNKENDQSGDRSDGSSTPMTSDRSYQNVCSGISDVLKSMPEPLPEFCSQLLLGIASKAVANPVLSEFVQSFIQLRNTHPNTGSQASSVPESSTQNVATECSMPPLDADSKASKNDGFHQDAVSKSQCTGSTDKDRKMVNSERVTKNIGVSAPVVDPHGLPFDSFVSEFSVEKPAIALCCSPGKGKEKRNDAFLDPLQEMHASKLPASVVDNSNYSPATYMDGRSINECPFSGVPVAPQRSMLGPVGIDPVRNSSGYTESTGSMLHKGPKICSSGYIEAFHEDPIISSRGCIGSVGSMFHKGVICDGCGARPITGPRFKSQVKDNYDLCSICFAKMGNEADYIRIDRPVSCRHPRMNAFNRRYPFSGPQIIDAMRRSSLKQTKLDSSFVADVNVFDGTVIAPSTPFTKIWRLRNSGTSNWPRGTQLMWTGGDKFSHSSSVEIAVPADGLPLGQEIEIAVDFTTPPHSGQYTSYWRMASPSGQRFGQRVWVLIQVDEALGMPDSKSSQALDLNLPPMLIGHAHEGVENNSTPEISDGVPFPHDPFSIFEPVKHDHDLSEDLQILVDQGILVGESPATFANKDNLGSSCSAVDRHGVLPCSTKVAPVSSCPFIDFPVPTPPANPPPTPSPKVSPASSENVTANNANNIVEETLLKTLEDMGFKRVDLNKEVLKRNEYDLELSVDELCGVSEWDPMLDELEEMGFIDKEMNKRLLMKNNGSVKRVVMELLYGEKA
ncbi:protein JOKA2 isoform X2 [Benincasa hispida]|uniref:protein JOKA2 isoform X2 n=1 Tax=Benincasa hispida TaxID=102211 RepID=UPI00190235D0|nr:protein JOKA2 isoform X2 [Benincasa hispida]